MQTDVLQTDVLQTDVPAGALGPARMGALQRAVAEQGEGLVVLGGVRLLLAPLWEGLDEPEDRERRA